MFKKILIANRGEIAVRVIRTCRDMGIKTVAIYSDSDRNALHVRLADEAYALSGNTPRESYLNTDKILEILKASHAEALHPGYGFFSENADFARTIESIGVTFIGPPPDAIETMGDKISSRIAAQSAEVAGVPGISEEINEPDKIIEFGETFGWPVAIKAAYGGGGRGMKLVHDASQAQEAMESAQREAQNAFGRGEIYVEKYLAWPRHIEMQVFADSYGNAIWISERDCSIQRRHQKLIEESPAPSFPAEIREKMGSAAVRICKACNYRNAGTVEFLYQDGEFYFLEMNTRLQVEHPITEATTGLDLVKMQILVAAGEKLPVSQDEIERRGHAFELRINAEDPAMGKFIPHPGKISYIQWPLGPNVRSDTGYSAGDTVSQFYDNLIGKLITWGPDRESARLRALRALEELQIEGIPTTKSAHQYVLSHPDFIAAIHSTRWLEEKAGLSSLKPFDIATANTLDDEIKEPTVVLAEVNNRRVEVKLYLNDQLPVKSDKRAPRRSIDKKSSLSSAGSGAITVPMQGTIVKVMVEKGQEVQAGDIVCILEAMKMENTITTDKSGKVSDVRIAPGDAVSPGDVLVVID